MSAETRRQAFAWWLRTGWLPSPRAADGVELKFNPNHDLQNGRFTFGSGGSAAIATQPAGRIKRQASLIAAGPERGPGRGDNIRAFQIPMTLEQTFPGLQNAPGGAIIAVADDTFDFTGPANEMTMQVLQDQSKALAAQIKTLDPYCITMKSVPRMRSGRLSRRFRGLPPRSMICVCNMPRPWRG